MRSLFIYIFLTLLIGQASSQTGRISGVILDAKTGETLPGASIIIFGTTRGATADFDGKFSINNVPSGRVVLLASYVSYTNKKIADVVVPANDAVEVNVQLEPASSQSLTEVEVVVTLNKENNVALVLQQKNSAAVSDGISSETIKRTPDRNTSDVLKRVSGVTIQDDKFVIIRGLNERYNASFLNGAPLPSTESDKKAFAFDLFPSNMLDNIVINKTATPDMPSEFAGGIVQINTKSIPEKNFVLFSGGAGYNTITTGKTKIAYNGGKFDNLGFDDGSRNLPKEVPSYEEKASWISNPEQARMATYFKNDWGYSLKKFAPNYNFQFATGYNIKRKEKDFMGIIFSLSLNNNKVYYDLNRYEYDVLSITGHNDHTPQREQQYANKVYQTQASSGGLLNLAFKLNENNSLSLKNLFTGASENNFIYAVGTNTIGAPGLTNRITSRFFSANQILSSQLSGEHLLPKPKIKISWNNAFSSVKRTVPDLRFMSYTKSDNFNDPSAPYYRDTMYRADVAVTTGPNYAGYRVYSALTESIVSSKFDASRLFKLNEKIKIDAKVGAFYQLRQRQYNIRQFGLQQYSAINQGIFADDSLLYLPEGTIFSQQNMSVTPVHTGGFKLAEITTATDNYHGKSTLFAGYGMGELKYTDKFRLITGLRFESYYQQITIKYPKVDSFFVKSTVNDLLPSLNTVYNITEKFSLRTAYYKTLNRAEFRELTLTNWFDPLTRLSIAGNPDLKRSYIHNGDLRLEYYPGRGQLFTATGFYKYFNSPIEKYMLGGSENQIYYRNANFANVYGAELEVRMNLGATFHRDSVKFLNNTTFFTNLSLIKSEVNVKGINDKVPDVRTMQGQAPYIINAGLSYIDNKKNYSFTAIVNRVGSKIYVVGNDQIANRWENARTVLDIQATKSFFKNKLELRLNIKDLLHPDYIIYYKGSDRKSNGYKKDVDFINFQRNFGSVYSFIVTYKF